MTRPGCDLERSGLVLDQPVLSAVGQVPSLSRWAGIHQDLRRVTADDVGDRAGIRWVYLLGLDAAIGPTVQAQVEGCLRENAGRQSTSYCDP